MKGKRKVGRPREVESPEKTNVILPAKTRRALRIRSATSGESMGAIVRKALEKYGVK